MTMGLDLYIEARVREKKSGRVISFDAYEEYAAEEEKGFFEICWWCGWDFSDIRKKLIEISNRHAGTRHTDSDLLIPVPRSALRDIYAYLIKRCCLTGNEPFEIPPGSTEWQERNTYEKMNLVNANKLHDLLYTLDQIEHEHCVFGNLYKEHILNVDDQILLEEHPQDCEWEFRILNSY